MRASSVLAWVSAAMAVVALSLLLLCPDRRQSTDDNLMESHEERVRVSLDSALKIIARKDSLISDYQRISHIRDSVYQKSLRDYENALSESIVTGDSIIALNVDSQVRLLARYLSEGGCDKW